MTRLRQGRRQVEGAAEAEGIEAIGLDLISSKVNQSLRDF